MEPPPANRRAAQRITVALSAIGGEDRKGGGDDDSHSLGLQLRREDVQLIPPPVGRGQYGAVYRGRWQGYGVAAKLLLQRADTIVQDLAVQQEAAHMANLRHDNIVWL